MALVHRISLCSQMCEHVMPAPALAFVAQCRYVDRGDDDSLAGPGRRFSKQTAVKIDHLAAAGPRVWRIKLQARALIGGDHIADVLDGATAIHDCPPIHRLRCTPGVHVGRYSNENLRAVCGELPDRFGEDPIVTDRTSNSADRRVGDWKERLVITGEVVRTR